MSDTKNLWRHPRTGVWHVRIMRDGERMQKSTRTRNIIEARRVRDAMSADIWRGEAGLKPRDKKTTFGQLCDRYIEWAKGNHRRYDSDFAYCKRLTEFFGADVHINKITAWDIEKFKKHRGDKGMKPATINHEVKCLKHMFRMANDEWNLTSHNPTTKTKRLREDNTRIRYLSDDERRRLLKACAESEAWHLQPIVLIAMNAGLRRGEILNLRWHDIDTKNRMLTVHTSKNGQPRQIPMNDVIIRLFNSMERTGERVFEIDGFKSSWARALKNAAIHDFRFHDLRHDFASQLAMSGANLITIKELLGHSSVAVTQRYAHLSPGHKRDAVQQLESLHSQTDEIEGSEKVVRIR